MRMGPRDPLDTDRIRVGLDSSISAIEHGISQLRHADERLLTEEEWLDIRADIGTRLRQLFEAMRGVDLALGLGEPHDRLRRHFEYHPGEVVENYALMGVVGSLEWARRLRELVEREQIPLSRGPGSGLRPGQYRYDSRGGAPTGER
jgi:hypothetical protein